MFIRVLSESRVVGIAHGSMDPCRVLHFGTGLEEPLPGRFSAYLQTQPPGAASSGRRGGYSLTAPKLPRGPRRSGVSEFNIVTIGGLLSDDGIASGGGKDG